MVAFLRPHHPFFFFLESIFRENPRVPPPPTKSQTNPIFMHTHTYMYRNETRICGFTKETLIAVTTNIESREWRRQEIASAQLHEEHPRASTSDDCECFFSVMRDNTVLLGKRVDFDHSVVFADFTSEICMLSNLTCYLVRPMDGLFISRMTSYNHLLCGLGK